jgi:molybdate transport system substrate-binding protein
MEQSIRNQLPGTIKSIVSDKVLSEVIVETRIGEIASVITTHSVEEVKLKIGDDIFVLIKATNVSLRRRRQTPIGDSMKTRTLALLLSVLIATGISAAELTVHAAASLSDAMNEIGPVYEKESGDKLRFNFGASSMLARQIEEGAPADLFFSADEAKMDALEKKDLLLPGTRHSLLSNLLVIVVPADASAAPKSATDLAKPEFKKLALAEPQTVPAGIYAREYLQKLSLWDAVRDKVVPTENVRAALAAVESGNVEAGIVYKTDSMISKKVKIAVEIPAGEGPKISYPIAVLKSSKHPDRAKKFAEYLAGPMARPAFEKFGFTFAK